jgi:hypothetical protein
VIGRARDGRRFIANTPEDRELLESFAAAVGVGPPGSVSERGGHCIFDPE